MSRTSVPCSSETRDALKELKEERGQDWDSFLLDIVGEEGSNPDNSNEFNIGALAREVSRELDYAQLAKQVADELEGRMA